MEETAQRQQKSIKEKKLLKDSADVVLDIVIDRIQDIKNDNNNRIILLLLSSHLDSSFRYLKKKKI